MPQACKRHLAFLYIGSGDQIQLILNCTANTLPLNHLPSSHFTFYCFNDFNYIYVYVFLWEVVHMPHHTSRDQKIPFRSQFSLFTMWVLGFKLVRKGLCQLNPFHRTVNNSYHICKCQKSLSLSTPPFKCLSACVCMYIVYAHTHAMCMPGGHKGQ